ncbi:hypothetical protein AB0M95_24580 [Sphaerisporangium sp. NPDC051017]|uniref:hypothetical protein n=1 Tax=Sphaerisporangium sp. NPDC051017 TaxID=3154636 RepID=UPI003415F82C
MPSGGGVRPAVWAICSPLRCGLPYTVEVQTGAPLAWKDLLQVQESMYMAVVAADGVGNAISEVDPATDEIRFTYSVAPDKEVDPASLLGTALKAAASTGRTVASVPVRFTEVPEIRSQDQATIKGGHWLTDSSANACTSGFTITVGGLNGVATAMHCPNYMGYEGASGVIAYRNAASTTSSGANIDLQWHSTIAGNTTSTKFQADFSEERNVDSASNAMNDDPICNFGKGKNYQLCGTIYRLAVCRQGSLYWCGQAVTEENITVSGDSGGPWYLGNVAKGIHSGLVELDNDGITRSAYTPQTRVGENLGGNVKTS